MEYDPFPLTATTSANSPIASAGATISPIASAGATISPIAYTGAAISPIASAGATISPIASAGATTSPIAYTGATTSPIASTGATTSPIASTGATTSPIAFTGVHASSKEHLLVTGTASLQHILFGNRWNLINNLSCYLYMHVCFDVVRWYRVNAMQIEHMNGKYVSSNIWFEDKLIVEVIRAINTKYLLWYTCPFVGMVTEDSMLQS